MNEDHQDRLSSLSNPEDMLNQITQDLDVAEFIPSYIFDIVENERKDPYELEFK